VFLSNPEQVIQKIRKQPETPDIQEYPSAKTNIPGNHPVKKDGKFFS
jgi:hypothetical protein